MTTTVTETKKKTAIQLAASLEKALEKMATREAKAIAGAEQKTRERWAAKRAKLVASVPAEVARLVGE